MSGSDPIRGLVSVVIPHYNCPDLLEKCIRSLGEQTYRGLEVVIADDGSADVHLERLGKVVRYAHRVLPSVEFITHHQNYGAATARNRGASKTRGEYLFFLDSDVILDRMAIQSLVQGLQASKDAAIAYGRFIWGKDVIDPPEWDYERLKVRNYITTMSLLKKSVFPGFDESLRRHQDWDLWLTIAENGNFGVKVDRTLFWTPFRGDGVSSDANVPLMESVENIKRKHGWCNGFY